MSIPKTSRSYLALLRSRFDRLSAVALALLAVGAILRVLYAFPTHKFPPDADSLLSGLRALDILGGKLRVFYSYVRIGALESYMHVPAIRLFGVSRTAISFAPLFSGVATLFFFFFFVREILGRPIAVLALLFLALPSPSYMAWTYMPNGYSETMLLCAAILYFAARTARTGHRNWSTLAFGLAAGAGLWQSLQTLTCTAPALLWLLWRRRDLRREPAFALLALGGFLAGASPWIAYNVVHPFGTFQANFVLRPASGPSALRENASYFLRYDLKELLVGRNPLASETGAPAVTPLEGVLQKPAAAVYGLSFLALAWLAVRRRRPAETLLDAGGRQGLWLLWMIAGTLAALDIVSEAGAVRGLTVRYVLPFFIVAAASAGILVDALWQRRRWLAGLTASLVLTFNLAGYYWPWSHYRQYWRFLDRGDRAVVEFLQLNGVRWVCGNYWTVYPLNFLSNRRVLGLPFQDRHDHYGYEARLPPRPVCWAIVAREPRWLQSWVARAELRGRIVPVGGSFWVFLPDDAEVGRRSPLRTLAILKATATWGH